MQKGWVSAEGHTQQWLHIWRYILQKIVKDREAWLAPYAGMEREFCFLIVTVLSGLHIYFHCTAAWFFSFIVTWSAIPNFDHLSQVLANFFCKGPDDILDFVGCVVCVTVTQLCHCRAKAAIDNIYLLTLKFQFILVFKSEKVKVLVTQFCPALCDPMGCSLSGYSVHGVSQARILEWVAISFSMGSSRPRSSASQANSLQFEPLMSLNITIILVFFNYLKL